MVHSFVPVFWRRSLSLWLVGTIPAVCLLALYWRTFSNVPRGDDLLSILPFACDWTGASWGERFQLIIGQYFSHRIAVTRLVTVATVNLFGEINLVVLQAFNLVLWFIISGWLVHLAARRGGSLWAAVPVSLLLLQPLGYTNVVIAMQGAQNNGILLLGLGVMILATRPGPWARAGAFGLAALAVVTSANGLVLTPLLALLWLQRREWRSGALALVAALGFTALYFHGFDGARSPHAPFSIGPFIQNYLTMLGAPFSLGRAPLAIEQTLGAGLLLVALFLLIRHRARLADDPLMGFILFLLGSVALASVGRIGWGAAYMEQDRYSPYGLLLAACLWILVVPWLCSSRRVALLVATSAAALLLSATSYARAYPVLLELRRWSDAVVVNHALGEIMVIETRGQNAAPQQRAQAAGLLQLSGHDLTAMPSSAMVHVLEPTAANLEFSPDDDSGRGNFIIRPVDPEVANPTPYAVLLSGTQRWLLPGTVQRLPYARILATRHMLNHRHIAYLWPYPSLPPAEALLVGLDQAADGNWRATWTGRLRSGPSAVSTP